jgi:nitrogen fixation/metabolism regulation signal transduction histidine kinase
VVSLLLELAIMSWVLQVQISRPLQTLTQAADKVAAGDFQVDLHAERHDELGRLAHAFRWMTDEVHRREEALRQANEGLEHRVEERTRELKETHRQLVGLARQAGMAEIATNVLHNVGNVLNSVHTSATVARERLTGFSLERLDKVVNLLEQHQAELATFLTQTARGQLIVPFLKQLADQQRQEREELRSLLDDVSRYTEHIGTIVKVQQDYASFPRLHESVHLTALVEDALRINEAALGRDDVKVERHFAALSPVVTDKHKVLMILVNLISNARHALEAISPGERLLILKVAPPADGRIRLTVIDNGVGIDAEMLTHIFQHGFTTRQEGHGFGLHSSALAAQDLGGSLMAQSEGPGRGAAFTLELPYQPGDETA